MYTSKRMLVVTAVFMGVCSAVSPTELPPLLRRRRRTPRRCTSCRASQERPSTWPSTARAWRSCPARCHRTTDRTADCRHRCGGGDLPGGGCVHDRQRGESLVRGSGRRPGPGHVQQREFDGDQCCLPSPGHDGTAGRGCRTVAGRSVGTRDSHRPAADPAARKRVRNHSAGHFPARLADAGRLLRGDRTGQAGGTVSEVTLRPASVDRAGQQFASVSAAATQVRLTAGGKEVTVPDAEIGATTT